MAFVLGISASHNGAYCLLEDGEIRVAIQEERLVGVKRARVYGARRGAGLRYCLGAAGIEPADLSMVVLSCQRPAAMEENDIWLNPDLSGLSRLRRRVVSHHLAHAASVVATSGFDRAAVVVADGLGSPVWDLDEAARAAVVSGGPDAWEHLSLFSACHDTIRPLEVHAAERWIEQRPHGMWDFFSLGGMFSAVAEQIFGDTHAAGKVMGLAACGQPVIPTEDFLAFDGEILRFTNRVQRRFQDDARWPERADEYADLAASAQTALEYALLRTVTRLRRTTGERDLCLAGGVALNSVANERIRVEAGYERVFVIPAAEDSGVALGAAYLGHWALGAERRRVQVRTDAHGLPATAGEIEAAIRRVPGVAAERPKDLLEAVVDRFMRDQIGGWVQGGSELGPRALGHRSILCSPCGRETKDRLNARIKFREAFRPFAPAVLADYARDWFELDAAASDSPFMLRVARFRPERRERVPAVVHVDGTGRLQTLTSADNGLFHALVERFHARSGVPILLNTSMNIQGEPIVETPEDALWCFVGTGLDFCVIHGWLVTKRDALDILDLVPGVVAEACTLRLGVADGRLQTAVQGDEAAILRTSAPWGDVDVALPLRLLPLLSLIDGRRSGRDLVAAVGDEGSAARVANDLLVLRRMRVIDLVEPRVRRD